MKTIIWIIVMLVVAGCLREVETEGGGVKKEPKNPEEEQEVADRLQKLDLERQKRRFINSLIQGSSKKALYLYHMVEEKLNEINPEFKT